VDVPLLDELLMFAPVSLLLTVLIVGGFTNAMNIMDGLHGLAGGLTLSMLLATAWVAYRLDDPLVIELCMVMASATVGFLLVNFPRGLIFLGDGGAYFLGFMLVQLWLCLLHRHGEVTPWLFLGIGAYPTIETVFSIYRRRFRNRRLQSAILADRLHLHCLAYRRVAIRWRSHRARQMTWRPNAACAATLALAGSLPALVAAQAPTSGIWQACVVALCAGLYVTGFRRLIARKLGSPKARRGFRLRPFRSPPRSQAERL
jgi:UDP-N-acetylmuramyl pentapeptide phosphotransferase/UDP-N-acetylglucosamine-1-phosphate transferase